jgi:hypothetical protein
VLSLEAGSTCVQVVAAQYCGRQYRYAVLQSAGLQVTGGGAAYNNQGQLQDCQ